MHRLLQGCERRPGLADIAGIERGPEGGQGLGAWICGRGVLARRLEIGRILLERGKGAPRAARSPDCSAEASDCMSVLIFL